MSGLLALLDDVAAIAKVAAASVDDVITHASKAGAKAAGAVIDDAAVTPKYVHGFSAERELPIVWRIARGSLFNKLVILLPAALLLSAFAPWAIPPLLMLGGAYLCFEGAEKVWQVVNPADHREKDLFKEKLSDAHLEEKKVKGAIKTDFILSAEIMTIALSALPELGFWMELAALAVIAVGITAMVYGSVALIVKADDFGLFLARAGRLSVTRRTGELIVRGMPAFMKLLMTVGTAAMLWVGGSIIVHGLTQMGWAGPEHWIEGVATSIGQGAGEWAGAVEWTVTAVLDGILGLALGAVILAVMTKIVAPFTRKSESGA
ncbi:DUF808 family protein [Rhodobacteraceae bacterium 2CG4]|uniref:DUF808 family protein n=1 Tax=Halovulum marinum TaxID=2662447 RepID=A0A6L5Z6L7_9RHOB|nr:DUF808 domain-containing protein [Halovulum marinum]MSU91612.1 DUF808 family protein [Halovulum marinum]